MRLGGVWHFDLCICLSFKAHSQTACSMDSPMNFKVNSILHFKKKSISTWREKERERKTVCGGERVKESQCVKPKYYYTCYNSLLFQWQGSWSEGDFITLQVIASYIKLGWPQFLGSTNVWLPVKLTALHHRVIRLACWLCIKQEQTQLAALLRLPDGDIMMKSSVAFCTGRCTERGWVWGHYITFEQQFQTLSALPLGHGGHLRAPQSVFTKRWVKSKKDAPSHCQSIC